ncbi:hypothetical protein [Pseudomonas sp. TCU-HL1]|uniref:hypothetical protein n=1 Tax=Pseudomonas sp. TCU-HL1 TaxID=1856685 RepID=UPI00083D2DC0|nr:hypothetical protein [Pseudomonas sp. TCU-HL1]AOE86669.1 hypothetical protein THL1_4121 [Pseudomonas sp. TCU-HL1]
MKVGSLVGALMLITAASGAGSVLADHQWDRDEDWEDEYRDGPCRVKEVSDDGEYKKEIKCPDGRGKTWRRGEWKREFWDGPCRVKIEAKRDEYKEEVKCEGQDDD